MIFYSLQDGNDLKKLEHLREFLIFKAFSPLPIFSEPLSPPYTFPFLSS